MKKDWAMLSGWGAGVFAAATVVLALAIVETRGRLPGAEVVPMIFMSVVLGAGPGLFFQSWWFSVRLKRRHQDGATRGSTLALGTIVGALTGVPAVLITPFLFFGPAILGRGLQSPETLFMLALGLVSGATTGFTCAWRISRPSS